MPSVQPSDPAGYFDAAAGRPLHPVAVQAWQAAAEDGWADPGKLAGPSRRSALLLDAARETVAEAFGLAPDEVSFLPSGVHALQSAVLGAAYARRARGARIVHSAVEHSAVLHAIQWHVRRGGLAVPVGVDAHGKVSASEFLAAVNAPGTAAAVLQAANHEVGTRQPVEAVAAQLRDVPLVVDVGHQVVFGAVPDGADIAAADARLWGGPGLGILIVRRGRSFEPPFPREDPEFGRSAGVPDVPAAVAAAAALRAVRMDREADAVRLAGYLDDLRRQIAQFPDAVVLGDPVDRLPHLLTLSLLHVDGQVLLDGLERSGFIVSSGSSCTSDTLTPSHVLVAMGALTTGNIRISLHPGVNARAVERFAQALPSVLADARAQLPGAAPLQAGPQTTTPNVVDSRGRRCPLPVLDLARALPLIDVGTELLVLADDPAAGSDIEAWCRMRGQELVDVRPAAPDTGQPPGTPAAVPATAARSETAFRVRRLS
ncbi:cysteine desulfurase/sulfurtransferase TusA family protein [Jatrophihabitans telluris]|uniref:Cysteine desulfurase/sulfurtransferase TusA family protein n=1 Tax=Jatrophihabitans telluris TaxID=2038343 RepID=A0ABY4QW88_9ACTN|nr:cysteine desulfurase/sulfurtransferase TusA family protein [Jatrophihabitans telluris]UQX87255.1 cysteine desulfurase/sulfurtransferase TusA family protein [Jatrophihabitans telluris]